MKKLLSLLLSMCYVVSLAACSNSQNGSSKPTASQEQTDNTVTEAPESAEEELGVFNKNASITETVLFEENGVKITATGLSYTDYSADLALTIENNSGKDLSFISNSLGYSCNSINGYMVNDGYLNCDVANEKKANDTISFSLDSLMLYGINEIADIEIGFDISDADYNHTYSGPRQIKTSAFETHDYSPDYYQESITSSATQNAFGYEISYFSQDCLYDESGVKLLSSGWMVNQDGETALLMEMENTTDSTVYISTADIALNDLVVYSSNWSNDAISPGKRCIVDIELNSVLEQEYWDIYGIESISSVSLSIKQRNSEGNEITGDIPVAFNAGNVTAEYDATGTEVYNSNGVRIVSKTIWADSSDYSNDMYVLLLAENNSEKTLSIEDVYGSLSVNGFMVDYFGDNKDLVNGQSAVFEIQLLESSLTESNITSISGINEVEFGIEISEGENTIDTPVVKLSFE